MARLDEEYRSMNAEGLLKTTAREGASVEEIEAGIREVQEAQEAEALAGNSGETEPGPSTLGTTVQPAEQIGA